MKYFSLLFSLLVSLSIQDPQLPEMNEKDTGAVVKASYLYNFAKYIDWPEHEKQGNFIISIMGGDNLYQELVKNYNSKQIGLQQIEIRKLSKTLNISDCHILYVGKDCRDLLPEIVEKFGSTPTLIVTDGEQSLENGSAIAFVWEKNAWLFDLKTSNADSLYIGSTLKSLARQVQ
jgi:hypothetical protein